MVEWTCLVVGVLTVAGPSMTTSWQDGKKPVMTSSTDFATVTNTIAYVDKTPLLGELFSDGLPRPTLVTAPQGFGKTTNMDMISAFLSIPVDAEGQRTNPNLTAIHKIFTQTKIYQTEPRFFYRYFGRFPVLYVDLETANPLGSLEDWIDVLKHKVHYCYRRYSYIRDSDWVDDSRYVHLGKDQVLRGLGELVDRLYRHFDERVILMIDNYDSLVTAAMTTVDDTQLILIMKEVFGLLRSLISNDQVMWTLVTGTLPVGGSETGVQLKMDSVKFLDHHPLSEYFGFSEEEFLSLMRNEEFRLDEEEIKKAYIMYSPYKTSGGKLIYCPGSVLKFLKKRKAEAFWDSSFYLDHLITVYKDPELENTIDHLLKDNNITMEVKRSFRAKDILMLRSMFLGKGTIGESSTGLLLNYLLHAGYLTWCEESGRIKLANQEIKETILEYLWNAHTVDVDKDGP